MKTLLKVLLLSFFLCGETLAMNAQQPPVPTVQEQVQVQEVTTCEKKVAHYKKKLDEHPNSPYYQFLYNLWTKRCPDE